MRDLILFIVFILIVLHYDTIYSDNTLSGTMEMNESQILVVL